MYKTIPILNGDSRETKRYGGREFQSQGTNVLSSDRPKQIMSQSLVHADSVRWSTWRVLIWDERSWCERWFESFWQSVRCKLGKQEGCNVVRVAVTWPPIGLVLILKGYLWVSIPKSLVYRYNELPFINMRSFFHNLHIIFQLDGMCCLWVIL